MDFKESYKLGQKRKQLEIIAKKYNAWPRGLVSTSPVVADDITSMTQEIRNTAQQRAEETKTPKNLLEKISFTFGYFVGPHTTTTSMCTSNGPINPFTRKTLYQN